MVKVIPFELFVNPAVIGVKQLPHSVACTSDDFVIVATDSAIEFFHTSKPQVCIATMKPVTCTAVVNIAYVPTLDAIVTIEAIGATKRMVNVYAKWRDSLARSFLSSHKDDFESSRPLELSYSASPVPHPAAATAIATCNFSGKFAVISPNYITVHILQIENELSNGVRVVSLYQMQPSCTVLNTSICDDHIAYASTSECHVFKIKLFEESEASSYSSDAVAIQNSDDFVSLDSKDSLTANVTGGSTLQLSLAGVATPKAALKDSLEVLGPIPVENQGICMYPNNGMLLKSCHSILYRQFPKGQVIHTIQLLPSHQWSAMAYSRDEHDGVCCFVSDARNGYMYDVSWQPRILSVYPYMSASSCAALSDYLLYVGSQQGVEIYTIRNALSSNSSHTTAIQDITMVGSVRLIGGSMMAVSESSMAVLCHDRDSTFHDSFSVYSLKTVSMESLLEEMKQKITEFVGVNLPMHYQLLLESHYLLRSKVSALLRKSTHQKELAHVQAQLLESSTMLGDLCRTMSPVDWLRVENFYRSSDATINDIIRKMVPEQYIQENTRVSMPISNVQLRSAYIAATHILFGAGAKCRSACSAAVADTVLNLYGSFAPLDLYKIILESPLQGYSLSLAKQLLQDCAESTLSINTIPAIASEECSIALALVILRQGRADIEYLNKLLKNNQLIVRMCLAAPSMLIIHEIPDVLMLHEVNPSTHLPVSSPLAIFLLEHNPELLKSILLQLIASGKCTVASAVTMLLPRVLFSASQEINDEPVIGFLSEYIQSYKASEDSHISPRITTAVMSLAFLLLSRLIQLFARNDAKKPIASFGGAYTWMAHLHPFHSSSNNNTTNSIGISSNITATLTALQDLASRYVVDKKLAEPMYKLVTDKRFGSYPGQLSLQLLCLSYLEQLPQIWGQIEVEYLDVIVPYTVACQHLDPSPKEELWTTLLSRLLDMVSQNEAGSNGYSTVVRAYQQCLSYAASFMEPSSFLALLPSNGSVAFYIPFIELCIKNTSANSNYEDLRLALASPPHAMVQ